MPRELGDVLDYFLPNPGQAERGAQPAERAAMSEPNEHAGVETRLGAAAVGSARNERPAALPIVAVPIGERDVLHAAFTWNLAVELSRLGAAATVLTPPGADALWPEAGQGPVGAELQVREASDLGALNRAALDVAVTRAAEPGPGDPGLVLVCVPTDWLSVPRDARALLRQVLLFSTTERRDLMDTYALAKRILSTHPNAQVGVTIHGARRIADAERAYSHLADVAARYLGRELLSYGLLVDDLHIYRAIVARRPIGLEHPQSRAARALRDVARLLLGDARENALA